MSVGLGAAKLTVGYGWDANRNSMDGMGLTGYYGAGLGLKPGVNLGWNVPSGSSETLSDLVPSSFEINYGYQGIPLIPFNAGLQVDYTKSLSIGDLLTNVFSEVDNVTNGWLSGTSSSANSAVSSSMANGGFVLYPNKSNTNQMRSVYSK